MAMQHDYATKTATDQSFGGRRVALNNCAITQDYDSFGTLRARGCECIEFCDDEPVWRIKESPGLPSTLTFVESVEQLAPGKWTWQPRV